MARNMKALRTVGVPYTDAEIAKAAEEVKGKTEMEALIAYLQVLAHSMTCGRWPLWSAFVTFMGIVAGPGPAATRVTSKKPPEPAVRARRQVAKGKKMSDFTTAISGRYTWPASPSSFWPARCCCGSAGKASKRKVMANDNTTGHVWDGDLREMNNPLPRWWVWLFVITIIFRLGLPGDVPRAWALQPRQLPGVQHRSVRPKLRRATRKWSRCMPSSTA
jgi:hypothetical protein